MFNGVVYYLLCNTVKCQFNIFVYPALFKIRIKDNGKGIPKKDWKNIFRPGFSTKKAGWGLGLSLANRIIEDIHKGNLRVLSSTINKGTIIEIIL